MLSLNKHNLDTIQKYYTELVTDGLINEINQLVQQSKLKKKSKEFLTKLKIEQLLCSEPKSLNQIHNEFYKKSIKGHTEANYLKYLEAKVKKKRNINHFFYLFKYSKTNQELNKIFDYDKIISANKKRSYDLSKIIEQNTCVYCNRLYTFTIIRLSSKGKENDSKRITRPQFDHWFPKKKYPLLALSFYNLIPSCPVCNSSVKGDDNYTLKTHVHPYIDESKIQKFKFSYTLKPDNSSEVNIKTHGSKIARTLKDMKVQEIYDAHSDYELQDLLDLRHKYSDNYLDILFNKTFKLSEVDKKDAYRMLFGVEIDPKEFHRRPFSKFKYDILRELKIIR